VLEVIEQRCNKWRISFFQLIFIDRLNLRTLARYLKMRMAVRKIRQKLQHSQ
jgi:hypothetical protein